MAEYQIHSVRLSSPEEDMCEELKGETFFAKDDVDAERKAYEMLKEKLADCLSEHSFEINFDEVKVPTMNEMFPLPKDRKQSKT